MLQLITGSAGTGKSYEMMKRISKAVSEGKKVYAIVPDQFNFEYNRMLYRFMGMESFNRMEVVSFTRLAKYIFTEYGGLRGKYADDTVKTVMMYRALAGLSERKELAFYAKQAKQPRFIPDALEFVKTFSLGSIAPETLAGKLPFIGEASRKKMKDISLIYSEYSRLLAEQGYKDGCTDISEAAKKASQYSCFKDTEIFIDEFKSFTPDEYEFLAAMIRDAGTVAVCLTTADKEPVQFSVFETVSGTAEKLKKYASDLGVEVSVTEMTENRRFRYPELKFLSDNVFSAGTERFEGKCGAVRVYKAAEPYAEADFVCAEINRLVREENYRYSDITVVSRCKENYSSILDAAFSRGNIPFYSDEKQSVKHKALIIFVSCALKIVSSERVSTEDMLRYIKTGYAGLDIEQAAVLEEYCYKWNVEGNMWLEPFPVLDRKAPEHDRMAEKARSAVIAPLEKLRRGCADAAAKDICSALDEFLDEVKVRAQIVSLIKEHEEGGAGVMTAVRETKQLWETLCALLQTLYRTLGDTKLSPRGFCGLFEAAVSSVTLSSPPQTLDAVNFSASQTARYSAPRAVFVMGANDGMLPFAAKPSPLLSDRDIEALREGGIELPGSSAQKLAEERFVAYASLSAASEKLYVTYPSADVSGGAMYPAAAVSKLAAMFGDDMTPADTDILYFCSTENDGYYQYVQNFKKNDENVASLKKALEEFNGASRERVDMLSSVDVRGEHALSASAAGRLFGNNIALSPSRFEDYMLCPFKYFCKKGLYIYPREKVRFDAAARGNAVHFCLCEILKSYKRDDFLKLSEKEISEAAEAKLKEYYDDAATGGGYGKTNRFNAAFDRLSGTVTEILLNLKSEFSQSEFYPDSFEYKFSDDGDEKPVKIKTSGGGASVCFTGAVDRIDTADVTANGNTLRYVRVIDYKTGGKTLELSDLYYGINMQMFLYLFALTDPAVPANSGPYHAALPAGVLYYPAHEKEPSLPRDASPAETEEERTGGKKMDGIVLRDAEVAKAMERNVSGKLIPAKLKKDNDFTAKSDVLSERQFDKLRAHSAGLLEAAGNGISSGKIEASPLKRGKTSPCTYCDYRAVCGNYPNDPKKVRVADLAEAEKQMKELLKEKPSGGENDNET